MPLRSLLQPKRPLDEVIAKEGANAFNLVRLVAAAAVIFGHSFVLSRNVGQAVDPAKTITDNYLSGTLAVMVFFLVSGIFVSQSLDRDRNLLNFTVRRVFRIWPGLLVCLFVSAALAASFSTLSWPELLAQRDVFFRYVGNGALLRFDYLLPGAFGDRPMSTVNGSIWTLLLEVRMYAVLAVLATLGLAFRRALVVPAILFLSVLILLRPEAFENWVPPVRHAIMPCLYFLAGMVIYTYRNEIKLSWWHVVFPLVLFVATAGFIKEVAFQAFLIAGTLWIGSSRMLAKVRLPADYSYGVYLYGFPVQQVLATWVPSANPYLLTLLAIPASLLLAVPSWYLVEKLGIGFGRSLVLRTKADWAAAPVAIAAPILLLLVAGLVALPH